ncbi:MAG: alpha/beta fold hydrolase [Betaproteobacteria bacterium]|nr:alpha/beta fold hydrolase [Betaproteobacteria bacterium]
MTKQLAIVASDNFRLQAIQYPAAGGLKGRLIIAGATGVPQGFYSRLARFAAAQGVEVWTIDYRGVGLSRPASLRGFRVDYLDWARLDLAALLDHVCAQGNGPIWMIGHSYGGHALGLIPNNDRVQRFATFATGAGWHGWMPPLERFRVLLLWNILGPILVYAKGYLAWSMFGMGEDLPRDVFFQWRRWCRFPRYFFDDAELPGLAGQFAQVQIPIRAINATDDKWAPPASRDAFMSAYCNARLESITVKPRELGVPTIGHMGYFRPHCEALWQQTLDWLQTPESVVI